MAAPTFVDPTPVLGQLSRAVSQGTLNVQSLQAAAGRLGCTVGELLNGLKAAAGPTTGNMASGLRGPVAGCAKQIQMGVEALRPHRRRPRRPTLPTRRARGAGWPRLPVA